MLPRLQKALNKKKALKDTANSTHQPIASNKQASQQMILAQEKQKSSTIKQKTAETSNREKECQILRIYFTYQKQEASFRFSIISNSFPAIDK